MSSQFEELEKEQEAFWSLKKPSDKQISRLYDYIEALAIRQRSFQVVEHASHAILHIDKYEKQEPFYQLWFVALYELGNEQAIQDLAKHLIKSKHYTLPSLFLNFPNFTELSVRREDSQFQNELHCYKELSALQYSSEVFNIQQEDLHALRLIKDYFFKEEKSRYSSFRQLLRFLYIKEANAVIPHVHEMLQKRFKNAWEPQVAQYLQEELKGTPITLYELEEKFPPRKKPQAQPLKIQKLAS